VKQSVTVESEEQRHDGGSAMIRIRLISKEEAQRTRATKTPGVRRQRMDQFDEYVKALAENPGEAVIYEGIEEAPQHFVLSLRGAFKRAGMPVVVRKMRGRDEVRAWLADKPAQATTPLTKPAKGRQRKAG